MRTNVLIALSIIASVAHGQDFKRGSGLTFEYPAARTVSGGRTRCYSAPARPDEMLPVLATATRVSFYPTLSFAVAVEGETTIDGVSYRLFFPADSPREAPYVFAAPPKDPVYFEISRENFTDFARLFRHFLNEHGVDLRP